MPFMDGFEVARLIIAYQKGWMGRLKEEQTFGRSKFRSECPVIAVTAYQDKGTSDKALQVGMKRVLHKPVTLEILSSVVDEYLPQRD